MVCYSDKRSRKAIRGNREIFILRCFIKALLRNSNRKTYDRLKKFGRNNRDFGEVFTAEADLLGYKSSYRPRIWSCILSKVPFLNGRLTLRGLLVRRNSRFEKTYHVFLVLGNIQSPNMGSRCSSYPFVMSRFTLHSTIEPIRHSWHSCSNALVPSCKAHQNPYSPPIVILTHWPQESLVHHPQLPVTPALSQNAFHWVPDSSSLPARIAQLSALDLGLACIESLIMCCHCFGRAVEALVDRGVDRAAESFPDALE